MKKQIEFPQYRKLSNGKSYYKIESLKRFEEIQLVGRLKHRYTIEAQQYPEMVRIYDMLNLEGAFEEATAEEWEALK